MLVLSLCIVYSHDSGKGYFVVMSCCEEKGRKMGKVHNRSDSPGGVLLSTPVMLVYQGNTTVQEMAKYVIFQMLRLC